MKLKKILGVSLFSLVLGLSFSACSDDDDNGGGTPEIPAVVGTWKYNKVEAVVEVTDPEIEAKVIEYIEKLPNEGVETFVFKADNSFALKIVGSENDSTGVYKFEKDKIYFENEDAEPLVLVKDSLRQTENVKAKVIEALELADEDVTKADALKLYNRITK